MSDSKGQCFVMQPFDNGRYGRLYQQVFAPAIRDANLEPYRVDNDPGASIPIETIEEEITGSVACFGEVSENNPNVWFELGYAIARQKPLCLVCSTGRTKFPFDVQHRKILRYPTNPLPIDYEELKRSISGRLVAVVSKEESRRQNAEAASTLSVAPETSGLAPHELLALTLIFEDHFSNGARALSLPDSMKRGGYVKAATNLALTGLIRKKLVEQRTVVGEDGFGNAYQDERFFVTLPGENWLIHNQQKLNLRLAQESAREVDDEDIPF